MNPARLRRLLVVSFPPSFRHRYGEELTALVSTCPGGREVTFDLARACLAAWFRPSFLGDGAERRRLRLEATTMTVFVLWSASTVAAAVFARAVDDPYPLSGLRSWGWTTYQSGTAVFELTSGLVLVAGFAYWLQVVAAAWRRRDGTVLAPALLPPAVVVLWLAVTAGVVVLGHRLTNGSDRHIAAQGPSTLGGWLVLATYVAFTLGCVVACSVSAVRALSRSRLSLRLVAGSTIVAGVVSAALVVITITAVLSLSCVLMIGGIGAPDTAVAAVPVVLLVLASAASVASSIRGVHALVTHRETSA
jgi:hypothetical protein